MVIRLNKFVILYFISMLGVSLILNYYFLNTKDKFKHKPMIYYLAIGIAPISLLLFVASFIIENIRLIFEKLKSK